MQGYLYKNELAAIERIKPDFEREISSMKNDKISYNNVCSALHETVVHKDQVIKRTVEKKGELKSFIESEDLKFKDLQV